MNNTIIIVNNIDNVSKIQEIILQYPNSKIFSLNYFTHNKLIKNSIEHEIGDNYLTNIDKNIKVSAINNEEDIKLINIDE